MQCEQRQAPEGMDDASVKGNEETIQYGLYKRRIESGKTIK